MNTIWSLKPGLVVFRLFGYLPFRITTDNRLELGDICRYYSSFLILLFATLSVYSFFFEQLEDNLASTVNYIILVLSNFATLFSLLEAVWKQTAQKEMLENFQHIDHILQTRFSHTIQVHLRRHFTNTISAYLLTLLLILVVDIVILVRSNATGDYANLAYYYVGYTFTSLRYLQIIYFTWMIRKRLHLLNGTLMKMGQQKSANVHHVKTVSFKSTIETVRFLDMSVGGKKIVPFEQRFLDWSQSELTELDVLRDVYNKLWVNSQLFNKAFGLSLLVNLGYDFLSLTTDLYWIIVSMSTAVVTIKPTPSLYVASINAFPHFANVLILCAICHYTVLSAKDVALLNNKFDFESLSESENYWIQQFSLQMIHQRISFSANGFFDIDFTLLFTIVGACTTYLVILVQFRMSEYTNPPTPTATPGT